MRLYCAEARLQREILMSVFRYLTGFQACLTQASVQHSYRPELTAGSDQRRNRRLWLHKTDPGLRTRM